MTEVKRPFFSVAAMLAKWQIFGFALVALGRAIVRAERTHGRGAWEMAHHLEVTAAAAAHQLGEELSEALAAGPPTDADEIAALEHLAFIRTLLLVLALFAQHLRTQLAGRGTACAPGTEFIWARPAIAGDKARTSPGFLDSG